MQATRRPASPPDRGATAGLESAAATRDADVPSSRAAPDPATLADPLDPLSGPAPEPAPDPALFDDPLDPLSGGGAATNLPHPALGEPESSGWGIKILILIVVLALFGGALVLFQDMEPTTEAAPEDGFVKITSVPAGADIYLDDTRLPAQTPTQLDRVKPGEPHTLRVTLPGFPIWEQTFTLEDTTTPLEITAVLSEAAAKKARMAGATIVAGVAGTGTGALAVESTPPGASIYIDGLPTNKKTPHTFAKLAAGLDHVVLLELKEHTAAFDRITLKAGGKAQVNLTLTPGDPLPGRVPLRIETEPDGAEVVVNGYPLKKKSPVSVKLLAGGASELEVTLKGHRSWTGTVRPVPGVELIVLLELKTK